jgi:predicted esterase
MSYGLFRNRKFASSFSSGRNATTPHSIDRPVPVNNGQLQPSWFDIWHLPPHKDEYDEIGIRESTSIIRSLIHSQLHNGINSSRIVLVGFSQGAALSLMVGLDTFPEIGGLVSLSGWIPPRVRGVSPFCEFLIYGMVLICFEANDTQRVTPTHLVVSRNK